MSDGIRSHRLGPPLLAALLATGSVQAQIVTDGSVGAKVSLHGGEIEIGDNLFHSFETFGIATGQTATFTGSGDIKNVISRVTGGEVSNINGKLASRVGQADFYFLNPAGVMFGPNATLDVPGSFHVSTAHELRFADGARFSAVDKAGSGLTVALPEAFGFLDGPPNRITVDQSQLKLQPGRTLSLVGGDVDLSGGASVTAGAGTVNLVSVASGGPSVGQVRVSDGQTDAPQLGSIRLTDQAVINTQGDGGGTIRIRGGVLAADDSIIDASNTTERAAVGGIDLHVDTARLTNSRIVSDALGPGRAGSITVAAGTLEVRDGGAITSNTHAGGDAGTVSIRADSVVVSGGPLQIKTVVSSDVIEEEASGAAEGVTITASTLEVRDGGVVSSDTLGRGRAGTVTIGVDHLMVTSGRPPRVPTRISSEPQPTSIGTGGSVKITAGAVEVSDGAAISATTLGTGNAGDVIIYAHSVVVFGGTRRDAGISSKTFLNSRGSPTQGGMVRITAHDLAVRDGGAISTDTRTAGSAGIVTIRADRLVVASGRPDALSLISSRTYRTGNGGTVEITAGAVEVRGEGMTGPTSRNADISTSTFSSGQAGNVIIHADTVVVTGSGGEIAIRTQEGTGNGGAVDLSARSIQLSNNGWVNTESTGTKTDAGVSGSITINATDTLRLDHGAIRTQTASANGGNVTLKVGHLFDLRDSTVTTSVAGGTGSGGNIFTDPPLMVLDSSRIGANAQRGAGGNITIQAGQLIRTPNSVIRASSELGLSGTISIAAPNTDISSSLVVLPQTFLDTSSQLREACAARSGRPSSTFTAGGRGGLPPDPGAPLAAGPFGQSLKQHTGSPTALTPRSPQVVKPITVAGIPQPVLGSPRLTCRG